MVNSLRCLIFLIVIFSVAHARAVEEDLSGTISYNTAAPTEADVPGWTTGWGAPGITGWNFVGTINNGASAVYLGNDWVLTAGHVGSGTFAVGGTSYQAVAGSDQSIVTGGTTADITLFQIASAPSLPSLTISSSDPVALSGSQAGTSVVMIGYGGSHGETWGQNTVTQINQQVTLDGYPYTTNDFETDYGVTTRGLLSATNNYILVLGDSGGGDFSYNFSTNSWELTGINEAVNGNDSYMEQLSTYATQINAITAVPEPGTYWLLGIGFLALLLKARLLPPGRRG